MAVVGLRAFFQIVEKWGVHTEQEHLKLLGEPGQTTYAGWKHGQVQNVSHDTMERLGYIVGIFKALQILYSDSRLADAWIRQPNQYFNGQSALQHMLGGRVTDLADVRRLLDAVRGG
ncbi:MAG: DUF2384 domain-containing protein [Magnetococcales bacterium]|nr:DUF2384 domain-containing protein [Magnetococcales bacterium]